MQTLRKRLGATTFILAIAGLLATKIQLDLTTDNFVDNWLYDITLAQNAWLSDPPEIDTTSNVIVVALDEKTTYAKEFEKYGWTAAAPKFATLIHALSKNGVERIGFDYVFAHPDDFLVENHEIEFLQELVKNRKIIVLGRMKMLNVAPRFFAAVGGQTRIGSLDTKTDTDNVLRRIPLTIWTKTNEGNSIGIPSFTSILTENIRPKTDKRDSVILAPKNHLQAIPTYSFIDILRCHETGNSHLLSEVFKGKIVLVGTTLSGVDRKTSTDRFIRRPATIVASESLSRNECTLVPQSVANPKSRTIPGVYAHAAAINSILNDRKVRFNTSAGQAVLAALFVIAIGYLAYTKGPWLTLSLYLLATICLHILASILLNKFDFWIPTLSVAICMLATCLSIYVIRYIFVDRRQRITQRSFNNYLSKHLVQQIIDTGEQPTLGGETRNVSVMFADLAGFTAMSERTNPELLVKITNDYLTVISEEVHKTNGYVDKYIGDAVMAIWGAPVNDAEHANNAIKTAFATVKRIRALANVSSTTRGETFDIKIGIASGDAVVGNVGSEGRLNYTAVGSTVNIASRLEGVTADYGCQIVVAAETMSRSESEFLFNEIDKIKVKGADTPLAIYQPLGAHSEIGADHILYQQKYAQALHKYRSRRFKEAVTLWESINGANLSIANPEPTLAPARKMAERTKIFLAHPPSQTWDGVWQKITK